MTPSGGPSRAIDVGQREGAVAQRILKGNAAANAAIDIFDPYDRQWDGMPVEEIH